MILVTIGAGSDIGAEDDQFWVNPRYVMAVGPTATPGLGLILIDGQNDKDDIIIKDPTILDFARQMRNFITTNSTRIRELAQQRALSKGSQGDSLTSRS